MERRRCLALIDRFLVCLFVFSSYPWTGNDRDCMNMFL